MTTTAGLAPFTLDLTPERFGSDVPLDEFAHLRRHAPVYWYERGGYWVVSSYELVRAFNRDFGRFSSKGGVGDPSDPMYAKPKVLLSMDPPLHSQFRRAVNRPFTPIPIQRLTDKVTEIVRECLESFVEKGGGDFVAEVAAPVPFRAMAALLGIPKEDEERVFRLTNAAMPNADPEYRATPTAAAEAVAELGQYSAELLAERSREPRDDLVSSISGLRLHDREMTEWEQANLVEQYVVGGTETTRHLLSHGLWELLRHPEQARRLVAGDVPVGSAVEEMLRYSPPVMQHSRWPTETIEIDGQSIQPGDRVTLWMLSANRDESIFERPDEFRIDRDPNPHTSFGSGGPHFCLGVHLARLEARVMFEELLPLLEQIELTGPVQRLQSDFLNGIKHVSVAVR